MAKIKDTYLKIRDIWDEKNLRLYASIASSFAMGTIMLVATLVSFSWIYLNYMMFYYLMTLSRVFIWYLVKINKQKYLYLTGAVILTLSLVPLAVSFVTTIGYKDKPEYLFQWLIYVYAMYAFIKMGFGIKNLIKPRIKTDEINMLSHLSLISALFTMFMMQFAMIATFSGGKVDYSMFVMELITQAVILIATVATIGILMYKYIKRIRNPKTINQIEE